jgi:membrane protein
MRVRAAVGWLKEAARRWSEDHAAQLGASLAYYAIFAVGPLLLIAIALAGLFFGRDAAQHRIVAVLTDYVGQSGAQAIEGIILRSSRTSSSVVGAIAGLLILLFGATTMFGQLDDALNIIWRVKRESTSGWRAFVRQRLLSLLMVLGTGFLLLVAVFASAALSVVGRFFSDRLPGGAWLWRVLNFLFQFGVITLLFSLIFKILPRSVKRKWRDVWASALITAVLFTIGRFVLALYLGRGNIGSPYGAAGSLIGLLVWIYYAAQILFFGAELTHVYAERFGSRRKEAHP